MCAFATAWPQRPFLSHDSRYPHHCLSTNDTLQTCRSQGCKSLPLRRRWSASQHLADASRVHAMRSSIDRNATINEHCLSRLGGAAAPTRGRIFFPAASSSSLRRRECPSKVSSFAGVGSSIANRLRREQRRTKYIAGQGVSARRSDLGSSPLVEIVRAPDFFLVRRSISRFARQPDMRRVESARRTHAPGG